MDYRKPDIEESFQWLVKHLDGLKLHGLLRGNAKKVIQKRQYKKEKQENTKTYGKDL
jgi:protein-tyrosine phosphatase